MRSASSSSSTKRCPSLSAPRPSCPSRRTGCAPRTPVWKSSRSSLQSPTSPQTADRMEAPIAPRSLRSRQRSQMPARQLTTGRRSSSSPTRRTRHPARSTPGRRSLAAAGARRLAASARSLPEERERARRLPSRDRRPARLGRGEWTQRPRETTIVDYLRSSQQRARPAQATYYRRFLLVRKFLRWVSQREGVRDPFLDLEPPPKPRHERTD